VNFLQRGEGGSARRRLTARSPFAPSQVEKGSVPVPPSRSIADDDRERCANLIADHPGVSLRLPGFTGISVLLGHQWRLRRAGHDFIRTSSR